MSDKTIQCVDCGADFVFTDREQEWYREKGLVHEPRRCKNCRSSRKGGGDHGHGDHGHADHAHGDHAHGDHAHGDHGHDDHGSRPAASSADAPARDRPQRPPPRPKEMHKVACATCGKETEIPFKPDPSRPVYCRDCYVARGKKR